MIVRCDSSVSIPLADGLVQCVVTSPPYWGLRDYGVAGQLGLERTPEEFVGRMVGVFAEVWRVLRGDGVLWLNLGDCYATGAGAVGDCPGGGKQGAAWKEGYKGERGGHEGKHGYAGEAGPKGPGQQPNRMRLPGLKAKDLVGMPWRVAFALQAWGWFLRMDVVWAKPNPMPESVRDRPTRSHEYVFLLTKSARYRYDADAIREPVSEAVLRRPHIGQFKEDWPDVGLPAGLSRGRRGAVSKSMRRSDLEGYGLTRGTGNPSCAHPGGRNKRSVWFIAPEPNLEAHFAAFPEALVEPCVLAGAGPGDVVLDPFAGTGTVVRVAQRLGRRGLGLELNGEYCGIARRRTGQGWLDLGGEVAVVAGSVGAE